MRRSVRNDVGTTGADADPDVRSPSRMLGATLAAGGLLAVGALALEGPRAAVGVALGAALAAANLWVISRVVRALVGRGGRPLFWALVGTVKVVVLMGAVYLLVMARFADILPLVLGYGALFVGILEVHLRAAPQQDESG